MQLAFSSNAYLNYPLEETVARIGASTGFIARSTRRWHY